MNRLLILLVLASCAAPAPAETKAAPAPAAPATTTADAKLPVAPTTANPAALDPPPPQPFDATWSPPFDPSLLCKSIPDAKAALGDASNPEVSRFGTTESLPPAPSSVRGVEYRFAAGKVIHVVEMSAKLVDIHGMAIGTKTVPAKCSETVARLGSSAHGSCVSMPHASSLVVRAPARALV